ncbi:MAG: hypothetical protein KF878_20920 [Planctomycetes bacterium]|nr:hypothetical protein [Planctomycetota bacterium]
MTPEAIGHTVCDAYDHFARWPAERRTVAAWDALVQRLHDQLVAPDPARGAAGLLWVVSQGARYPHVNLVGELLVRFRPPCPASLEEVLDLVEARFTSSAHRVAAYLRLEFGEEALVAGLEARAAGRSDEARRRVAAFLFALAAG